MSQIKQIRYLSGINPYNAGIDFSRQNLKSIPGL